MRLKLVLGMLVASTPVMALDPVTLPDAGENSAQAIPRHSFVAARDIAAEGVPVEAVLSGAQTRSGWIARLGGDEQVVLNGLDPVSYFESGGPEPGSAEHRAEFHGGVFYFASKQHRDLFLNAPDKYAPAFGGYDPERLAQGSLLPADPQNWTLHEGRLFLSGSRDLKNDFDKHRPEVIKAAQEKWKAVDEMFEDRFFKAHQD